MKKEDIDKIIQENRRGYNQIAEKFSHTRKYPWSDFNLFKKYFQPGRKILDAGCGNGRLFGFISRSGADYTGLDSSEALIAIAKKENPSGKFLLGAIQQLPFNNGQFDVVACLAALHHLPGRELRQQAISEFNRVLKSGGHLLMLNWNLWNINWWPTLARFSWQKLTGRSALDWGDVQKPWKNSYGQVEIKRFLHAFTKKEMKRLLEKNGFKVIDQRYTVSENLASWYSGYNLVTVAKKA